jgi:hypothetical protein
MSVGETQTEVGKIGKEKNLILSAPFMNSIRCDNTDRNTNQYFSGTAWHTYPSVLFATDISTVSPITPSHYSNFKFYGLGTHCASTSSSSDCELNSIAQRNSDDDDIMMMTTTTKKFTLNSANPDNGLLISPFLTSSHGSTTSTNAGAKSIMITIDPIKYSSSSFSWTSGKMAKL